jgi:hypothetical protein
MPKSLRTGPISPRDKTTGARVALQEWPDLPWDEWAETAQTFHLWTQVIGKIRLALVPPINHWWHTTLYLTCRGLTTAPMPYGNGSLQIDFDFLEHQLVMQTSEGQQTGFLLQPMTVASFYQQVMDCLERLGTPVDIWTMPVEIPNAIPFEQDQVHSAYDGLYVTRFWQILLKTEQVFNRFRCRFLGKVSPVHFFWGAPDLAMTRFSGRKAPVHASVPGIPDFVVREAYSHEVSSCGFWPGGAMLPEPVFYAYAYPAPAGFSEARILPKQAYFHPELGEFVLPYRVVQQAEHPDEILLLFLQSSYEAAANLGHWNRAELER